jgi:TIR domain-containing protein
MVLTSQRLFYSYSSQDEALRSQLEKHLTLLKREGLIKTWSFRNIDAGQDWKREIDRNLESATVILLLVSADFIASDYCWNIEMTRALERNEAGDAVVVPVILKPCDWKTAPFAKLQALPEDARPVTSWRPRDRAWANVAAGLRRIIQQAQRPKPLAPPPTVAGAPPSTPQQRPVSAVDRAKRVAQATQERKSRAERLQSEGVAAVQAETLAVFENIERIVTEINDSSPELDMRVGWKPDQCVVRIGKVSMNIYPYYTHPITESRLIYRLWFGGITLPQDQRKAILSNETKGVPRTEIPL